MTAEKAGLVGFARNQSARTYRVGLVARFFAAKKSVGREKNSRHAEEI
jgi:hypothetical protein